MDKLVGSLELQPEAGLVVNEEKCSQQEQEEEHDDKPKLSYIALISMAIQSEPSGKLLLCDIYDYISTNYPQFHPDDRSWRNSVRHNLSLNECFIKSGRADNGKGHYWAIHPANVEDFSRGDYHRRRARRRVRMTTLPKTVPCASLFCNHSNSDNCGGYVPMTLTSAPAPVLAAMFGDDVIYTPKERAMFGQSRDYSSCMYGSNVQWGNQCSPNLWPNDNNSVENLGGPVSFDGANTVLEYTY